MRKTYQSLVIVGVCLLVAAAAFAEINPRGIGQPAVQTVFRVDTPAEGQTVFGIVQVKGFILDPRGVSMITLLVDGAEVHDVDIDQPRDDVRRKYPGFRGEPFPFDPGFTTSFLATNYTSGEHTIALEVTYNDSTVETLGERTVTVDNSVNQAPIGAMDSPRDPVIYGQQDIISGVYPLTGWALDDTGVRKVEIPAGCNPDLVPPVAGCHWAADIEVMVDGRVVGQAIYWLPRPDISNAYPDVAAAIKSGWQVNLDTTNFVNGDHDVAVRVWDTQGMNRVIASRRYWIDNNYATLRPVGRIDWPMNNGHLYSSSCYTPVPISGLPYDPTHHIDWVSGWVLDQNDIQRFTGVKYVELLLDGALIAKTNIPGPTSQTFTGLPWGCFYFGPWYQTVNCHGKERLDIEYRYPQFGADAKNSGFLFAVDVDELLNLGFHRGLHYLGIRAGSMDPGRPAEVVDQIPVILDCNDLGDEPSYGDLEIPEELRDLKGTELLRGWVIDHNNGIKRLNFYVDGILDGTLVHPGPYVMMLRMDVEAKYPWLPYPWSRYNGFEYQLDTTRYVDGIHQLVIESVDYVGFHNYWVQRPLRFNNPN